MQEVVVFGAGGHAKVVIDILKQDARYKIAAVLSKNTELKTFQNLPHFFYDSEIIQTYSRGIVAIGDNFLRSEVVKQIISINPEFQFINAIHPKAVVAGDCTMGKGNVLMAGAVVNSGSAIGNHVILNTHSSVDHDVMLESFCSIAPGAILGGNCSVGSFTAISLGARLIHGINIGSHTIIGAGALVLKDIPDYSVAYGSPCKIIRKRFAGEKYL